VRIDPKVYASLDAETKAYVDRELAAYERVVERNPLQAFEPHSDAQRRFLEARTAIVAAFAGNRFGKTTSLTVRALLEAVDADAVPSHLKAYKVFDAPTEGWVVVPTTDKLYDTMLPALKKWVPKDQLVAGKWDKSWSKERRQLSFKNGSTIAFKTYEQDPSTLGGADLHYVGYDEPPPRATRDECLMRMAGHAEGFEMFAMTPLKANTGWVRREIYKKRESPEITVIRGTIHDNPTLSKVKVRQILGSYTDMWRQAREFGDFVSVGGLIYPDFEKCVLQPGDPRLVKRGGQWIFDPDLVRSLDVVVGIDPGIRNAGFSWIGFDRDLTGYLFDEGLLQDKIARDYVAFVKEQNSRWGLRTDDVAYVIDPAAKQRAQANGMTVLSEINKLDLYPNLGENDQELGFGQMRARMQLGRLLVGPNCVLHRDQADDYAAKEPEEGKDDSKLEPIEVGAHCLASLRYAVMERFWDPESEEQEPDRNLGYEPSADEGDPSVVRPDRLLRRRGEYAPMGFMS
jgi:phage terminase large subunit-like protein